MDDPLVQDSKETKETTGLPSEANIADWKSQKKSSFSLLSFIFKKKESGLPFTGFATIFPCIQQIKTTKK